jgi:Serine dehydrogenase proteinase
MPAANWVAKRKSLYKKLEKSRGSKVILYVTGDRRGMETQIHPEVIDFFAEHLDRIFPAKKISLILYTRGGSTLAAWNLANLIRMFCDDFEIIVPQKARSAGTLMCLGTNRIVMTKQATLGPIDPTLQSPLAPQIPGASPQARAPVSVEAVKGYLDFVKLNAGIKNDAALAQIVIDLSNKVHPLVLGEIFRAQGQIQFLADELLSHQVTDKEKKKKIVNFLCSESGSHDYTINRREGAALGLKIEKASQPLYELLTDLSKTIQEEMELGVPFQVEKMVNPNKTSTPYSCVRAMIESSAGGSDVFVSEGVVSFKQVQTSPGPQYQVEDDRQFEGWRKR